MDEEKAAAYYDELTRKGSGAARFKQGLGFSDKDDAVPTKASSLVSFVKASSPTKSSHLISIQNKLKKHPEGYGKSRKHRDRDRDRSSKEREYKDRGRDRNRSRSVDRERDKAGYDKMSPAERVRAKMKLQLAQTAEKDASMGTGSGWERFNFNKDAPLDDEEIEAAEDDAALVKHIGLSFRFSAIEARREEQIKAAHDEAMFGVSKFQPSVTTDSESEVDNNKKESNESVLATNLLSEKVLAKQQGSWRDRARKV